MTNNKLANVLSGSAKKLLTTTAITAVGFLSMSGNAKANNWVNTTTTHGSTTTDTSQANTTNITLGTERARLEGDLDIDAGWNVNVGVGDLVAVDTEGDAVGIYGSLDCAGSCHVFGKNGIIVGEEGRVDSNVVTLTTGELQDVGKFMDDGDLEISNFGNSEIVNNGTITVAEGGIAAFVSPTVKNSGVIKAKMGKVVMAAGETVTLDMYGDGLVEVAVDGELADGLLKNTGEIQAKGGEVLITASIAKDAVDNVINMDGVVDVSSATVKGGKIVLSGGSKGTVKVKGKLKAKGKSGQNAGSINVTGQNIDVKESGKITADSDGGAAGDISVIADKNLTIDGEITAQGLIETGDIETSAPDVDFGAGASVLATRKWLLDPTDITIDNPLALMIENQLALADMDVATNAAGTGDGKIYLKSMIDWSTASAFSLIAHDDVEFRDGGGVNNAGAGTFNVTSGDDVRFFGGHGNIIMNGGDVNITAENEFSLDNGFILAGGGNILIDNGDSFRAVENSLRTSGTGTISVNQNKNGDNDLFIGTPLIQNAIDAIINTGTGTNTVNVGEGTWDESVNIDHANMTLKGTNAGTASDGARVPETVISPNSPGFNITADNATVDGFTITGADTGVLATDISDLKVLNNIIEPTTMYGVFGDDVNGTILVEGNRIDNAGIDGVNLQLGADFGKDVQIVNNSVLGDIYGIHVTGDLSASVLNISDNTEANANVGNGIHVDIAADYFSTIDINRNVVAGFGDGINVNDQNGGGILGPVTIQDNDVQTYSGVGIRGNDINGALVDANNIHDTGSHGIHLSSSDNVTVSNNNITNALGNGILINPSNWTTVSGNEIENTEQDGIRIEGGTMHNVRENIIRYTGGAGIEITEGDNGAFGNAWIAYNDISFTEGHGIDANNGNFVSIYDNYISFSGYENGVVHAGGGANVLSNPIANGIYVSGITGMTMPPMNNNLESGFGTSAYGSNVEIYGNDVAMTANNGIYALSSDSAYIDNNIVGHTGTNGIAAFIIKDAAHSSVVISNNSVSMTGGDGIFASNIDNYVGVFGNRVLGTGRDGINVHAVTASPSIGALQADIDDDYESGWTVHVADNEVAMTGRDGIDVHNVTGTAKIDNNSVFMAGMGEDLEEAIETINDFANGTFVPVFTVAPQQITALEPDQFTHQWGDGHGINVEQIYGSPYDSPNGWATDITDNTVKYTGGHGIYVDSTARTRIDNNNVQYAGLDETTFDGVNSMLGLLNNGPFGEEGRRDLWAADDSMIEVIDGYIGGAEEDPEDEEPIYVTVSDIEHDAHDGIHVEDVYGNFITVAAGITSEDDVRPQVKNPFALEITNNKVKFTGDDGINVEDSGRTLIADNKIRDAGYGIPTEEPDEGQDYGSGDEEGADGIRVTNVMAPVGNGSVTRASGLDDEPTDDEPTDEYRYEQDENYALVIRNNDIKRTADDGIEVVGDVQISDNNDDWAPDRIASGEGDGPKYNYFGITDRVLIAENKVRQTGYFDNDFELQDEGREHGYENVGYDGYGHDGVHVRNIGGTIYEDITQKQGPGGSYSADSVFYGYAVDVLNNDIAKTGDDGVEVFNSDSTLILGNKIRQAGVYWDGKNNFNTDGADYYGADGIHVRNVGGANPDYGTDGYAGPVDFEPYSVAIVDNDVRKTADDGIEVVGEAYGDYGFDSEELTRSSIEWDDNEGYNGTGRTLILANTIRDAGVSGFFGEIRERTYDYNEGSERETTPFGNRGSYDGFGGDGIHVRGVAQVNTQGQQNPNILASGADMDDDSPYTYTEGDYGIKILGNDVRRTGDDGIEVVGNGFDRDRDDLEVQAIDNQYPEGDISNRVLIENNFVKNAGLSTGRHISEREEYYGRDENNQFVYNYTDFDRYNYSGNAGDDGYGADGIHVRGISAAGESSNEWQQTLAAGNAGNGSTGYYGYAVDIINNEVRRTGDDGIEVRNSDSTFIYDNEVRNAGILSSGQENDFYESVQEGRLEHSIELDDERWTGSFNDYNYSGGDGIHVENVGEDNIRSRISSGAVSGDGFVEYAAVILDNKIRNSSDDGIEVQESGRTRIEDNNIKNSGVASFQESDTDTYFYDADTDEYLGETREDNFTYQGARAEDRRGSDGIHVEEVFADEYGDYGMNEVRASVVANGSTLNSVEIINNKVDNSGDDGIQVWESGTTMIRDNKVSNSGIALYSGIETDTDDDNGPSGLVASIVDVDAPREEVSTYGESGTGALDSTGGDGINVDRGNIRKSIKSLPKVALLPSELDEPSDFDVKIINNEVTNSADDGVEVIGTENDRYDYYDSELEQYVDVIVPGDTTNVLVDANEITNSGDNGIALITGEINNEKERPEINSEISVSLVSVPGGEMNSLVTGNIVNESGNNGLFVGGPSHNNVVVEDNEFTDSDIGMHFESGIIDLTGDANTITDTRVGMRFAPAEIFNDYGYETLSTGPQALELDPVFAEMSLVDNTIGTTVFDNQSEFFVELANGAFFDPGTPTLLRENDATFVGTPFGTFTPSVDFAGGYPLDVLAYLESKFYHFNDDGTLGLFFLEPAPGIDQEDVFNVINGVDDGLGGLNVTILSLPSVPGGPTINLNNIAPAAGGSTNPADLNNIAPAAGEGTNPEELNEIETASGGDQASCWGDALNGAGSGQATTLSYDGSAEDLLNGEASCGS